MVSADLIDDLSIASREGRLRQALVRYLKPHRWSLGQDRACPTVSCGTTITTRFRAAEFPESRPQFPEPAVAKDAEVFEGKATPERPSSGARNVITLEYEPSGSLASFIDSAGRRGAVRRGADGRIACFEILTARG